MVSLEELAESVERGDLDTVIVAFTDMQGRLVGKRLQGDYFLEEVRAGHPIEGPGYLVALGMEADHGNGHGVRPPSPEGGDLRMVADFTTLRRIPWLEGTALVLADVAWQDGSPVLTSPRHMLRAQVERARALGFEPMFGSELEFYVVKESYAEAEASHYRQLTPSSPHLLDYNVLAASSDEPFVRTVRTRMRAAGIEIENTRDGASPGQHRISFRFTDALSMADNHAIYKNGIKEIANQHKCSVTFMAKPEDSWIGSSCHVHSSLWQGDWNAFDGENNVFRQYLAGNIHCAADFGLFLAPTVNSYKRFTGGVGAPLLAWSYENGSCGFGAADHGYGRCAENRIPAADANPYLAFAATLAAGLYGIERGLEVPPAAQGNGHVASAQRFPQTLRDAISVMERSVVARHIFGEEVVDHYLNNARNEQLLSDRVVTEYERTRLFERV